MWSGGRKRKLRCLSPNTYSKSSRRRVQSKFVNEPTLVDFSPGVSSPLSSACTAPLLSGSTSNDNTDINMNEGSGDYLRGENPPNLSAYSIVNSNPVNYIFELNAHYLKLCQDNNNNKNGDSNSNNNHRSLNISREFASRVLFLTVDWLRHFEGLKQLP